VPIDIKKFEEASKPLDERIRRFLADHRDKAYSLMEIMAELEGQVGAQSMALLIAIERYGGKSSQTWDKYAKSVTELVKQGKVNEALVQGTSYYAIAGGNS
jgi:hypothetical protein